MLNQQLLYNMFCFGVSNSKPKQHKNKPQKQHKNKITQTTTISIIYQVDLSELILASRARHFDGFKLVHRAPSAHFLTSWVSFRSTLTIHAASMRLGRGNLFVHGTPPYQRISATISMYPYHITYYKLSFYVAIWIILLSLSSVIYHGGFLIM